MKPEIPNVDIIARSSELHLGVPFSEEQIGLLLGNLGEEFSDELPNITKNEKSEHYSLRNFESEIPKQISLILGKNNINLIWAQETKDEKALDMIKRMCNVCNQTIKILPNLLKYIDTEYIFDFETNQNHYDLIHETYFSKSLFADISKEGRKHLTNDIKYHLLLEDEKVLIVSITGTHSDSEIIKDKTDKKTLRIRLGVGQTRGLSASSLGLDQLFEQHLAYVEKLVKEELLQKIVLPLANKISK